MLPASSAPERNTKQWSTEQEHQVATPSIIRASQMTEMVHLLRILGVKIPGFICFFETVKILDIHEDAF